MAGRGPGGAPAVSARGLLRGFPLLSFPFQLLDFSLLALPGFTFLPLGLLLFHPRALLAAELFAPPILCPSQAHSGLFQFTPAQDEGFDSRLQIQRAGLAALFRIPRSLSSRVSRMVARARNHLPANRPLEFRFELAV